MQNQADHYQAAERHLANAAQALDKLTLLEAEHGEPDERLVRPSLEAVDRSIRLAHVHATLATAQVR